MPKFICWDNEYGVEPDADSVDDGHDVIEALSPSLAALGFAEYLWECDRHDDEIEVGVRCPDGSAKSYRYRAKTDLVLVGEREIDGGALIYAKSTGYVPDFYCPNEEALADIRARARGEVA